jgi:uncharacterized membrane protein
MVDALFHPSLGSFSIADMAALAWLAGLWKGYGLLNERGFKNSANLNQRMVSIRKLWMANMLARDNRVMDSMLMGHLINSVSFFASATVLVLAGLAGALASADIAHAMVMQLALAQSTDALLFQCKILLLLSIFIYCFFCFTWSLRQFNYAVALIGAAPPITGEGRGEGARAMSEAAAKVMGLATLSFNRGLRGYYYAFASLGWIVHPLVFMALAALVTYVLWHRQFRSSAWQAIATYAHEAERHAALAVPSSKQNEVSGSL